METIDPRITGFIGEHHVMTLAVSKDNIPWCAHCFYIYLPEDNLFVFTSDPDTRHIRDAEESGNFCVTAGIALETRMTGKIRGIQMSGKMFRLEGALLKTATKAYVKHFPVARLAALHLWGLAPGFIKLTDNRLGFGIKLKWEKENSNK
jgi:uncharacterized protein YhbP (UPF0306 family)